MKKTVLAGVLVLIVAAAGVYLLTRPTTLCSMSSAYTSETYRSQDVSFDSGANGRVKFSFKSDVKSGSLTVALYDSNENMVYDLGKAKMLETYHTFDTPGTYTLRVVCDAFVGNYDVKVYDAHL